jgi:hypothetical protein
VTQCSTTLYSKSFDECLRNLVVGPLVGWILRVFLVFSFYRGRSRMRTSLSLRGLLYSKGTLQCSLMLLGLWRYPPTLCYCWVKVSYVMLVCVGCSIKLVLCIVEGGVRFLGSWNRIWRIEQACLASLYCFSLIGHCLAYTVWLALYSTHLCTFVFSCFVQSLEQCPRAAQSLHCIVFMQYFAMRLWFWY